MTSVVACGGTDDKPVTNEGGATATGNGGATATGNGGATAIGNGGATATGNGGASTTGGTATGGKSSAGSGNSSVVAGGANATGGKNALGGSATTGGSNATGGVATSTGGNKSGGAPGTVGSSGGQTSAGAGGIGGSGGTSTGGATSCGTPPANHTIYVSLSGNDASDGSKSKPFKTLAKAASVAVAGDTVLVSGGTYVEQSISPSKSGAKGAMIVFKAEPGAGDVILKHPATSASTTSVFSLTGKSFIWIEGFQFKNYQHAKSSIWISGGSDNVIINNRFDNLGTSAETNWDANSVVWIYKSVRNVVRNNYFNAIFGDGISLNGQGTKNNLVAENTFITFKHKVRDWGGTTGFSRAIDVQDMSDGQNVVAFNYGEKVVEHIWLDRDGSNNVILRNVATASSGIVFNESRCAFNVIQENIGYGLRTAYQSARYSGTQNTKDARWVNNVAYNSGTGFHIDMSERDEFRNNIAFDNTGYNLIFTAKARSFGPHVFKNNLWFSRNKANSIQLGGSAVSVPQFQSSVGETGGLSTNPLFVSTMSGSEDFSLQASSPAKKAGSEAVDLGAFAVYPKTAAGWNSALKLGSVLVEFDVGISEASRGQQVPLKLLLNQAVSYPVTVEVVPVAGDAQLGSDFTLDTRVVTFAPGETSKTVTARIIGTSDHPELVAFRLGNASCVQPGGMNLRLLRIKSG